ncbi:MAG TPA: hypothetical protein VGM39_02605 [Kofleriaceae bacterium]|jgi:hypothetical protein
MLAYPLIVIYMLRRYALDARRKHRTGAYLAWSIVSGVTTAIITSFTLLLTAALIYIGAWWVALIFAGIVLVPVLGSWLIRHALVPLGAVRTAYYLGLLCRPGKDPTAYALVVAAWALANDGTGTAEAWLARRRDVRHPLGDAEVVATAFIVASHGDAETARQLLRSITLMIEDHPFVRELAGEWLACDSAERGAWREIATDATETRFPATPLTWLLEGIAARRLEQPKAPSNRELWGRWIIAPRRRTTKPLLSAALASVRNEAPTPPAADSEISADAEIAAPPERAPLPRAIAAHLSFAANTPNATAFSATVSAWDAALSDGATHAWLARRALELDAPLGAVDRALREISATVTEDLARIADSAQLAAPPSHGPVGDTLGKRLRHGRLDTLEAGFTRWSERRTTGEVHPAIDEWREFIALKTSYTAAVTAGGLELRRLAFPHAFTAANNMAAWLWNARNEYALSHAISKWLLSEALAVGDTEAIELGHRNCALYVPTRSDPAKTNAR